LTVGPVPKRAKARKTTMPVPTVKRAKHRPLFFKLVGGGGEQKNELRRRGTNKKAQESV